MTLPLPAFAASMVRCRGLRANGHPCHLVLLREPWRSLGMGEDCAERAGIIRPRRGVQVVGGGPDLLDLINEGADMTDTTQPTLNDLPKIAADICRHLAAAGYADVPAPVRQALSLAEEAGEFVAAVRRHYGLARRSGPLEDVAAEAADVVITTFAAAHDMGIDLEAAIAAKLAIIYSRGWREPVPDSAAA